MRRPNHSEVALKSFEPLLSLLATIADPRRAEGKLYQLPHVLLFSIFAIVSGANSYRGIRTYVMVHRQKLNKAFKIKWKRPPAHTAIRYILQGLSAADVEKAFREHAANLNLAPGGRQRARHRLRRQDAQGQFRQLQRHQGQAGAQRVRGRYGAGSGPYRNRRKIQRDPRGAEAVAGTRRGGTYRHLRRHALPKKTFEAAAAADAHLIVQLKDNQPILCQKAEAVCAAAEPLSSVQTVDEKRRNRHETRAIAVFDAKPAVSGTEWEPHVAAVIRSSARSTTSNPPLASGSSSRETSFYLSSRPVDAKIAADAIRKHWGIENKSHYTRDVTLREDASRIRNNPGIFARLRSFGYNILRCNQSDTIPQDRFAIALGGVKSILSLTFSRER